MIGPFQLNQVHEGDCLELMANLPDKCIDLILCDLPYGTTACSWDTVIPFEPLWEQYKRLIKPGAGIVLTASQPFTTDLINSNRKWFRYELIWNKVNRATGFLDANIKPLKIHENIVVFAEKRAPATYNKQLTAGKPYVKGGGDSKQTAPIYRKFNRALTVNEGNRNPTSIIDVKVNVQSEAGLHPTKKPVALFEYLIKTFSNEGELVLDNCSGSGTTGVACIKTDRNFIGFEMDPEYCKLGNDRIASTERGITVKELHAGQETFSF